MTLITVTTDRFRIVANGRSVTSMRTRRATGKVTSEMPGMMAGVNAAPDLKAAVDTRAAVDMAGADGGSFKRWAAADYPRDGWRGCASGN
jgi:hypothetical protein